MDKIITISREFGSGGREIGKRLADRIRRQCFNCKNNRRRQKGKSK